MQAHVNRRRSQPSYGAHVLAPRHDEAWTAPDEDGGNFGVLPCSDPVVFTSQLAQLRKELLVNIRENLHKRRVKK